MHKHRMTLEVHQGYSASGTKETPLDQGMELRTQTIHWQAQVAINHGP